MSLAALGSRNNGRLAWRSLMPRLGFVIWAAPRRARWTMHQVRDSPRAPFLALLALLVSSLLGGLTVAHATTRSFPCRWNWELATNLRPGYAVAGANANCAGRAGSLTISVRLQQQDSQTHTWQTLRSRARRFHDLRKVRFVQVAKRCASSAPVKYRAKLSWTLRDTSDVVVSHLMYTAGPVTLGC